MGISRIQPILKSLCGGATVFIVGCAGPSSPFGGLDFGTGDGLWAKIMGHKASSGAIIFHPKRQVLHAPSDVEISLKTNVVKKEDVEVRVLYNSRDVTHAFRKYAQEFSNSSDKKLKLVYGNLRLTPARSHQIDFYYKVPGDESFTQASLLPPSCGWSERKSVVHVAPFSPEPSVVEAIRENAKKYNIGEHLVAGLIAQESGYDFKSVSRARAIGLTQITPVAAREVEKQKTSWHRYKKFDLLSPLEIRYLVEGGEVTAKNDWRLDPQKSIEGGFIFLKYLDEYWALKQNSDVLSELSNPEMTSVILASYNSGAARVKYQMQLAGENWLEQPKLREAFRYVNSISSYCYHFAEGDE